MSTTIIQQTTETYRERLLLQERVTLTEASYLLRQGYTKTLNMVLRGQLTGGQTGPGGRWWVETADVAAELLRKEDPDA